MLRFMLTCLSALILACPALTAATAGQIIKRDVPGVDRPGGDYAHAPLAQADPGLCSDRCLADRRCAAFSYVRPGLQGPQAMCWLKNTPSRTVNGTCCQSGVKSYVYVPAPRPHTTPARISPPDSPNKDWCTIGLICANRKKGNWDTDRQSCECDPP